MSAVEIVRVGREAIDALMSIDAESFLRPWTRPMYETAFDNTVTRVWTLQLGAGTMVAYCSTWLLPGELHINNVAVLPAYRRRGLARQLLGAVLVAADAEGARRATLEVRRSNLAALRLYESLGFETAAVRPDYYLEPVEDALVLWREPRPPRADKPVEGVSRL
jgi:[ribosomal protein S18]-alanine N-acetyltransferase